MKKRKKLINKIQFIDKFKNIINNKQNLLPKFIKNNKYDYENLDINTCFNIDKFINKTKRFPIVESFDKLEKCTYKQIKVKMVLTNIHKQIFQNWFKSSTIIYNETLNYIRNNFNFTKKEIIRDILVNEIKNSKNFYNKIYIRNQLKNIKLQIQNNNKLFIDKQYTKNNKDIKCKIDIHTLDKTIFQLIQNINSAVTNMLNGNIKRFRLKFWKYNRPNQIIELEKNKISNGILCKSIFNYLEDIKYYYNNKPYDINNIDCDFKINYNLITKEYYLLVPIKIEQINIPSIDDNKLIVLDPGLRTFMTGISDNEYIKIGTNINKNISEKIKRLNKIKNNKNISIKIKNKNEKLINKKIYQ